jgi:hypothetical protein
LNLEVESQDWRDFRRVGETLRMGRRYWTHKNCTELHRAEDFQSSVQTGLPYRETEEMPSDRDVRSTPFIFWVRISTKTGAGQKVSKTDM